MKKLFTIILSMLAFYGYSQSISIDLSQNVNSVFTQSIVPQTVSVLILTNRSIAPSASYSISAVVKHQPPATLTIPGAAAAPGAAGGAPPIPGPCQTLNNDITAIQAEIDETQISNKVKTIQNDISGMSAADAATCASYVLLAKKTIADVTNDAHTIIPIIINNGDELDVTITEGSKVWTNKFVTQQINHWITSYGLTYVPDVLTHFPNYYAQQQTDGTYLVARMNGETKNILQNLSPSILLTYLFFKDQDQPIKFGLTGGFSYNSQTLGGSFGPSIVIGDVVSLSTGLTFVQKYALMGQYSEGQVIKDNLSYSQLNSQIWTYDIFFSIGFNIPQLFNKSSTGKQ